jgi:DNA-binding LacI/PurR family transcriptional regulator
MGETITRRFAADELKEDIRGRVERGSLRAGDPIASISDLADRYEIAYGTARKAIRDLVEEGILTSEWGKGTFVTPGNDMGQETGRELIAMAYPLGRHSDVLHRLQEDVMHHGGMLTLHNANEDNQDPELERKFLEGIRRGSFKGVGLFATPVPPLNDDLYHQVRAEGIKVALLSPHQYDMTRESVFLPNHRAGGYEVVRQLHGRGYRDFVFVGSRDLAVYKDWVLEGARRAELEFDARIRAVRDGVEIMGDSPRLEGHPLEGWMSGLEPSTAILTFKSGNAAVLEDVRKGLGRDVERNICIASCFLDPWPGYEHLPRLRYDLPGLLQSTVDYLLDDGISADTLVHHWAQPEFVAGYLDG